MKFNKKNNDWCEYSDLPSPLSYMNNNNELVKQIVYNSIKCLECNKVIVSRHRHDYVTCECPNKAMVDGGNEYERYGAMDMDKIEFKYIYADDDYEIVRQHATRGSRGKDGKQPLTWIAIADMDNVELIGILTLLEKKLNIDRTTTKPLKKENNENRYRRV